MRAFRRWGSQRSIVPGSLARSAEWQSAGPTNLSQRQDAEHDSVVCSHVQERDDGRGRVEHRHHGEHKIPKAPADQHMTRCAQWPERERDGQRYDRMQRQPRRHHEYRDAQRDRWCIQRECRERDVPKPSSNAIGQPRVSRRERRANSTSYTPASVRMIAAAAIARINVSRGQTACQRAEYQQQHATGDERPRQVAKPDGDRVVRGHVSSPVDGLLIHDAAGTRVRCPPFPPSAPGNCRRVFLPTRCSAITDCAWRSERHLARIRSRTLRGCPREGPCCDYVT